MQSSSSTHTFAKRGVSLDPPLIAGIVVVVAAFNLIIAVSWCIVRDRRKLKKLHKRRISAPVDCEKYEHSVAFAVSTGAAVPLKAKAKEHDRRVETGKSYYELLQALQRPPEDAFSPVPARWSRGSSRDSSSSEGHGLARFVLRPQDIKELSGTPLYPKTRGSASQTQVARDSVNLGVPARADLQRANSLTETASVYSSASAPLEYHDQLLRTQPFAVPTSAPAWMGEMPKPPSPAILSLSSASSMDIDVPCPSQSTSSASSVASTIVPTQRLPNPHSPIAVSPISVPSSSTPSHVRPRTYSNPSAPPQIRWITPQDNASSPLRTRRPNSISSLSTIFSVQEATRVPAVAPVTIAPLNIRSPSHRESHGAGWGSVDLSRSTPLASPSASQQLGVPAIAFVPATPTTPMPAQASSGPAVPARSPRRPAPGSASVEHLPQPGSGGTA